MSDSQRPPTDESKGPTDEPSHDDASQGADEPSQEDTSDTSRRESVPGGPPTGTPPPRPSEQGTTDARANAVETETRAKEEAVPLRVVADDEPSVDEFVRLHLAGIIEAVLFASEQPLTPQQLAKIADAEVKLVRSVVGELEAFYRNRGVNLVQLGGGYCFRTSPAFSPFVRQVTTQKPVKLTRAQMETLAVVAYRQPITRPELDEIRGVDSAAVLRALLDRGLVRILGRKNDPGRPLVYGTSKTFLRVFNLKSLRELPTLREFAELSEESRRTFEKLLGEPVPEQLSLEVDDEPEVGDEQDEPWDGS